MPNLWYNTRTKDDLIDSKAGKSLVVFIEKNFGGTLSTRKSLRTSALCLGLTGLMILSAGCATRNKPGTAVTTPANETTGDISSSAAADIVNDGEQGVSEPDKVKLAKAPNGFVSLLNDVEFGKNNFDEAKITWPDTIPLGESPLVYDEGIHVVGLEDDSGISDRFNISLTADKVAALPVFGDIYYTEAGLCCGRVCP